MKRLNKKSKISTYNFQFLLKRAKEILKKRKILSADLDSLLILSFVIKKPKEYVLAHPAAKINKKQKKQFLALIKLRAKRYPLAYIIRKKEFYGYNFFVDKTVLIPRPATEKIVDLALEKITKKSKKHWQILDLGTGSGCIAISLAKKLEKKKIQYDVIASDISSQSLANAKINIKKLKAKQIKLIASDLFANLKNKFDLILANLPYMPKKEIKNELSYEPRIALEDKGQIKNFLEKAFLYLKPSGSIIYETSRGKVKTLRYCQNRKNELD